MYLFSLLIGGLLSVMMGLLYGLAPLITWRQTMLNDQGKQFRKELVVLAAIAITTGAVSIVNVVYQMSRGVWY